MINTEQEWPSIVNGYNWKIETLVLADKTGDRQNDGERSLFKKNWKFEINNARKGEEFPPGIPDDQVEKEAYIERMISFAYSKKNPDEILFFLRDMSSTFTNGAPVRYVMLDAKRARKVLSDYYVGDKLLEAIRDNNRHQVEEVNSYYMPIDMFEEKKAQLEKEKVKVQDGNNIQKKDKKDEPQVQEEEEEEEEEPVIVNQPQVIVNKPQVFVKQELVEEEEEEMMQVEEEKDEPVKASQEKEEEKRSKKHKLDHKEKESTKKLKRAEDDDKGESDNPVFLFQSLKNMGANIEGMCKTLSSIKPFDAVLERSMTESGYDIQINNNPRPKPKSLLQCLGTGDNGKEPTRGQKNPPSDTKRPESGNTQTRVEVKLEKGGYDDPSIKYEMYKEVIRVHPSFYFLSKNPKGVPMENSLEAVKKYMARRGEVFGVRKYPMLHTSSDISDFLQEAKKTEGAFKNAHVAIEKTGLAKELKDKIDKYAVEFLKIGLLAIAQGFRDLK